MAIVIALLLAVALFVVGAAVVGLVFKLFWWLLAGLVIGALARLILPGEQPIGLLATGLFGIAGSLLGGLLADRVLHVGSLVQLLVSIGVAAVLVAAFSG